MYSNKSRPAKKKKMCKFQGLVLYVCMYYRHMQSRLCVLLSNDFSGFSALPYNYMYYILLNRPADSSNFPSLGSPIKTTYVVGWIDSPLLCPSDVFFFFWWWRINLKTWREGKGEGGGCDSSSLIIIIVIKISPFILCLRFRADSIQFNSN